MSQNPLSLPLGDLSGSSKSYKNIRWLKIDRFVIVHTASCLCFVHDNQELIDPFQTYSIFLDKDHTKHASKKVILDILLFQIYTSIYGKLAPGTYSHYEFCCSFPQNSRTLHLHARICMKFETRVHKIVLDPQPNFHKDLCKDACARGENARTCDAI